MTEVTERVPGWLRSINLDPGATRQQAITNAAQALAKESNGRALLDLVLVAHDRNAGDASERISQALRAQDETWDVRPGDREASLTAATAVAFGMESEPAAAVPFALAVRSAKFVGLQATIEELPELAKASLVASSEVLRARSPLSPASPDIKGAFAETNELTDGQQATSDQLKALAKGAANAATRVAGITAKLMPVLDRRLDAADEELNLLWWVFGEYSELSAKPFKKVSEQAVGCVSGIELSSFLRQKCPLPSTRALLSRVLQSRSEKAIDLLRAVPATCKLIGEAWIPDIEGHMLLPVLSSVKEYLGLERKPVWKDSVVARWGVTPDHETSNLDLAQQTAYELLLASGD